jgi:hypothetical protein
MLHHDKRKVLLMAAITQAERQRRDALYFEGLKDCTSCQRTKPLAEFHRRSDGYRGLYGECRKCKNAAIAAHQTRNPDKVNARVRRWQRENPERAHAIAKRYRDSHPEQERARRRRHRVRPLVSA